MSSFSRVQNSLKSIKSSILIGSRLGSLRTAGTDCGAPSAPIVFDLVTEPRAVATGPHKCVYCPRFAERDARRYNVVAVSSAIAHYTKEHLVAYPVEYIAGIDLYNAGEYHAAHDAWEERWMGPVSPDEKLFLQAMIQSAVAFHHLQIGRPGAARRMYLMAKEKFARLNQRVFMSLDLEDYQAQLDRALSWLLAVPDPREIEAPNFEPPTITLSEPPAVAGG